MKKIAISLALFSGVCLTAFAGNPDRSGSAGASELLINPWARSSGLASSSMCSVRGVESAYLNVAGLAFTQGSELLFTNTQYLVGTGIKMNSLGFGQKLGKSGGVLGLSVVNMNFGDIQRTTEALPEGGIGSFQVNYSNIGISYAKGFSQSIYGGLTVRLISESIYNVKAQGVAFDAGIRYVTGEKDNIRFGIALRNVGPTMRYRGDGLTYTVTIPATGNQMTVEQRSQDFELPSMVNVGFAYDFLMKGDMKLTANAQYTSNSFSKDQVALGLEYSFRERFILRGGYQKDIGTNTTYNAKSAITGPTGGFTVQVPAGQNGSMLGLDYSYRASNPFNGTHSMGLHLTF